MVLCEQIEDLQPVFGCASSETLRQQLRHAANVGIDNWRVRILTGESEPTPVTSLFSFMGRSFWKYRRSSVTSYIFSAPGPSECRLFCARSAIEFPSHIIPTS